MWANDKVTVVLIVNPLQPTEQRQINSMEWCGSRMLDYTGALDEGWVVSVNGRIIESEELEGSDICRGDCIVICPLIAGGEGSSAKSILRIVALIALTVVAPAVGAALAGTVGTAATAATYAYTACVTIGGTLLINAVLPPPTPKMPDTSYDQSSSYGIDGPKNTSEVGIPFPVIYGEAWFGGNVLQSFVENVGDTQYFNTLLNMGEGEIEDISDIYLNDQPLVNFGGVQIYKRMGTEDQYPMPYFGDIIRPVNRNVPLSMSWAIHTVTAPVDRLRLDFTMPQGIGFMHKKKGFLGGYCFYSVEIREHGGDWQPFGKTSELSVYGRKSSPYRFSVYSRVLDKTKRYEIRARLGYDPDETELAMDSISLTDVNEIIFDDIRYKHTALLGVRVRLDNQLNGAPTVIARVRGRKVMVWDEITGTFVNKWSDNPAWHVYDALTSSRYGGGLNPNRIKIAHFREWALFCEANNLKFNGVIDTKTNLWDALAAIFKVGRAHPVRAGTRFQIAIERKRKPVMMFNMGNIKKDSLSIEWLDSESRANEIRIEYFDGSDKGKSKALVLYDEKARLRGDQPKPTDLTLFGVNNAEQALREGTFALNMQRLLQTVTFEAPVESIACTLGDCIAVQHDIPQWGEGGRLRANSTTSVLYLDKPVKMDADTTYVVMVRTDSVTQWTGQAENVMGDVIVPSFGFNLENFDSFRLLECKGVTYTIEEGFIDGYGQHVLRLTNAEGINPNDVIRLIDTDVIMNRDVVFEAGEHDVIRLKTPLPHAPADLDVYSFGIKNKVVQLFTVRNITGNSDMFRTISALQYDDAAYDDAVINYVPPVIEPSPIIENVEFDGFVETPYSENNVFRSRLEFAWRCRAKNYSHAEVHIRYNGGPSQFLGAAASSYEMDVDKGEITVILVPVTIDGYKPHSSLVTPRTYTVVGGAPETPIETTHVRLVPHADSMEIRWGKIGDPIVTSYVYEVWHAEGTHTDVNNAVLIGANPSNYYLHDSLKPNTTHTYWVRTVNLFDSSKKSGFVPETGIVGTTKESESPFPGGVGDGDLSDGLHDQITGGLDDRFENISQIVSESLAKVDTALDGYKQEIFDRVDADAQVIKKVDEMKLEMAGNISGSIKEEAAVRVRADEVLALKINTMSATLGETIRAGLTEEAVVRAAQDEALVGQMTSMNAQLTETIGASINEEAIARATKDEALALQISSMSVDFSEEINAAIREESVVRAQQDEALAGQITTLGATVGANKAAIKEESTVRADAISSVVQKVTTLTSEVGSNKAAIQVNALAVNGLEAQYTVKIDNNGHVAGFGLASTTNEAGDTTSEFAIVASRFRVAAPNSKDSFPVFLIDAETNKVYLQNAIVGDIQSDNYVQGRSGWCLKK